MVLVVVCGVVVVVLFVVFFSVLVVVFVLIPELCQKYFLSGAKSKTSDEPLQDSLLIGTKLNSKILPLCVFAEVVPDF